MVRPAPPSVVVPQAHNLLLNPLHPAMVQVVLAHQEPFQLDQRLHKYPCVGNDVEMGQLARLAA